MRYVVTGSCCVFAEFRTIACKGATVRTPGDRRPNLILSRLCVCGCTVGGSSYHYSTLPVRLVGARLSVLRPYHYRIVSFSFSLGHADAGRRSARARNIKHAIGSSLRHFRSSVPFTPILHPVFPSSDESVDHRVHPTRLRRSLVATRTRHVDLLRGSLDDLRPSC